MFKMQKNLEIVAHDQFREFILRNQKKNMNSDIKISINILDLVKEFTSSHGQPTFFRCLS